jgi:hypothetical protein
MSGETFARLTPAHRAFAVEDVRRALIELSAEVGHRVREDEALSTATEAWLKRLRAALVDHDCSSFAYKQIDAAAFAAVPAEEADELRRRLDEFAAIRDCYPLGARSPEEALRPVLEELLRKAEAREAVTR